MPTYDFRCPAGHDFERFFGRISEAPAELECPECGAVATRRISGGAGLLFKGSGFYITDYGKDGKKDQRSTTGGSAAKGGESKAGESSSGGGKSEGSAPASGGSSGGDTGAKSAGSGTSSGGGSSKAGGE